MHTSVPVVMSGAVRHSGAEKADILRVILMF